MQPGLSFCQKLTYRKCLALMYHYRLQINILSTTIVILSLSKHLYRLAERLG
jgi:hypothetical protein